MSCPYPSQPCGGCGALAKLDATKAMPQNFLDLIHKQHLNKSSLNQWHDRLGARLPVEIMSRIFICFNNVNIPGEEEVMSIHKRQNYDHLLRAPMLLSRVCRRWRQVVISTPQLWTKYYLDVWTMASKVELVQEFISRSGSSLPLSFILCQYPVVLAEYDEANLKRKRTSLDPLTTLIRSYSHRWTFLDLQYVPEGLTYKLLRNLDYIPPLRFEGLLIKYSSLLEPIPLREPICPRHLHIMRVRDSFKLPNLPLQLHNITYLEVSEVGINTLIHLVKQTPRLTKWISRWITLSSHTAGAPALPPTPIILPTITHLELTFRDNDPRFFPYITLPALTHLQCHFGDRPQQHRELQFDDLMSFLKRSELNSTSLHTFDLHYRIIGVHYDQRFSWILSLTHLSVHIPSGLSDIVKPYLSSMLVDISIFPWLRELRLQTPDMPNSSWGLLCDLFRGGYTCSVTTRSERYPPPECFHKRPLKNVTVSVMDCRLSSLIPYDDYLFLQSLQKAGGVTLRLKDYFVGDHEKTMDILQNMGQVYGR